MITQEELKKHIHYDPFTGEFLRIGLFDNIEEAAKVRKEYEILLDYSENHGSVR